jgi:hypothetical protein
MKKLRSAVIGTAVLFALNCGPVDQPPPGPDPEPAPQPSNPTPTNPTPTSPTPTNPTPSNPTPTNPEPENKAGPWPTDELVNYSAKYGIGRVQDAGPDEGHNIWLLAGDRIGVLKAGSSTAQWSSGVGQAGRGYSSTVICGGAAGRAYVGYHASYNDIPGGQFAYDPRGCEFPSYSDCDPSRYSRERLDEFLQGDLDIVKLDETSGAPALEERIWRSVTNRNPYPISASLLGLRNTNDQHFDEDRSVYSCTRAVRGPARGDIFVGTNHGYTRIQGLIFNSHRHPIWYQTVCDADGCSKSQRAGYAYGLGVDQSGRILMANDWTIGIVNPVNELVTWDREADPTLNPELLKNVILREVYGGGGPTDDSFAEYRGFEQTKDGVYYVGTLERGLWQVIPGKDIDEATATRIAGAPSNLRSLAATDDGSLYIGSESGLYKMDAEKKITRVSGPSGTVTRLFYDPSVTPSALYIVAGGQLWVLRGS